MAQVIMPPPESAPSIPGVTDAFAMFRVFNEQPKEFQRFMDFWGDWLGRYEITIKAYADIREIEGLKDQANRDRQAAEQDRQDAASALLDAMKDAEKVTLDAYAKADSMNAGFAERQKAIEEASSLIDKQRTDFEKEQTLRLDAIKIAQADVEGLRAQVVSRETIVQEHLDRLKAAGFNVVI